MTPRALFLPSYLGGGFGHIGRCLAVAEALKAAGWEAAFALNGRHRSRVEAAGFRVFALQRPFIPRFEITASEGVFTVIPDLNYQLARDGLLDPAAVQASVGEQLGVVRSFKPSVIIADAWLLASTVASLAGVPLVQIIRPGLYPAAPKLIWWQELPGGLVSPDPRPALNPLLKRWKLPEINRAEDLLGGDLYLVASFPELEPLESLLPGTYWVGPLTRSAAGPLPAGFPDLDPDRPLVYVSLGGGAAGVGNIDFYAALFQALGGQDFQVLVSTGARFDSRKLPAAPANIRVVGWAPGPAVIARSNLVVYPGGYGTSMEAIQAGVPVLAIPFHSEQESNARRIEAAGAGRVLFPGQGDPTATWHSGPTGRFSTLVYRQSSLTPDRLRHAVLEALGDDRLVSGARTLQRQSEHYGGPAEAAEHVQSLITRQPPDKPRGLDHLAWWQKLRLRVS